MYEISCENHTRRLPTQLDKVNRLKHWIFLYRKYVTGRQEEALLLNTSDAG